MIPLCETNLIFESTPKSHCEESRLVGTTKQSLESDLKTKGLFRFARNDRLFGVDSYLLFDFILTSRDNPALRDKFTNMVYSYSKALYEDELHHEFLIVICRSTTAIVHNSFYFE